MIASLRAFAAKYWVVILLAVVPPLAIWYFFQRETKGLEFTIQSEVPVVSVQQQYADGLALTYRARPINSLHVVDIEVRNSGSRPLERSDYDTPLSFAFSGTILSPPTVVVTKPVGLTVEFTILDQNTLRLTPLLLNGGDHFAFRTLLVDRKLTGPLVTVAGRVKGIRELRVASRKEAERIRSFILGIISGLLGSLSVSASVFLLMRAKRFWRLFPSLRLVAARAQALEKEPADSRRASELARQLDIANHDYKSNILFLRLKIESQLRELARLIKLPDRLQVGSMRRLAQLLEDRKVVPQSLAAAIRDLYPTLSRELHEAESYVSPEDFGALQRLSLSVVGQLEELLARIRSGEARGPGV